MKGYRDSRLNRDRREDSFARAVIAEAERRRRLTIEALEAAQLAREYFLGAGWPDETAIVETARLGVSDDDQDAIRSAYPTNADRIIEALRTLCVERTSEQPLGDCPHCGDAYYDEDERQYHAGAECVGGMERFR